MSVECELRPRRDASSDQLRALGMAFGQWCNRESGSDGMLHYVSRSGLANLMNGEWPPSYLKQLEEMFDEMTALATANPRLTSEEKQRRRRKLKEDLGDDAERRALLFQVLGGVYFDRERTVQSLHDEVPADLVEDILIDGKSWQNL